MNDGTAATLSDRDREILAFERTWWRYPGAKEDEIRRRFDLSPTRYYQLLNVLIDSPAAELHDPVTVKRLRRVRDDKRTRRLTGTLG